MAEIDERTSGPKVSVIIATHNRPNFVAHAIQSVLAQTYTDLELIVIDDGSTDQTADVVGSFRDPRLRYEYQPPSGRSRARNRGLVKATGEYIAFLDDDDAYLPDKLATQVAFLNQHPECDLVAGGAVIMDESGKPLRNWPVWQDMPDFDILSCVSGCPLFPTIVMVRHEALESLGTWFDEQVEPAEDTDLFIRLALAGCGMAWDRRYVAYYRQHAGSSQGNARRYRQARLGLYDKLFQRDDLSEQLYAKRKELYAQVYLTAAYQSYALGDVEAGEADYALALATDPSLRVGSPPRALAKVAAHANKLPAQDQESFLSRFWRNLPKGIHYSFMQRAQTKSILHIQKVFRAGAFPTECPFAWQDWLRGVAYDPRWLLNRGVWAILFHNMGMPSGK